MKRAFFLILAALLVLPAVARRKKAAATLPQRMELSADQQRRLDYFMHEASRQMVLRNASAAQQLYAYCLGIDPTCPEALYQMATLHLVMGRDSLALDMLQRATQYDPQNVWYKEMLVSRYFDQGENDLAVPVLEDISRLRPKDIGVLEALEDYYSRHEQLSDALRVLERIETLRGRCLELSMEKADVLDRMGKKDAGLGELRSLERDFPYDLRIPIVMAKQYFTKGDTAQALQCYDRVRKVDPANAMLQVGMLGYYEASGQEDAAAHLRDSLLYAGDTNDDLREELIRRLLYDLRDDSTCNAQVLTAIDSVLRVAPTLQNMGLRLSFLEYINASPDSLEAAWHDVLRMDPANLKAISTLLSFYLFKQTPPNLEGAEEVCRMGINAYPDNLMFYRYLASVLYQQDRHADVAETLEAGLRQVTDETNPEEVSDLYALLGDAYHEQGREADAFAAYDSCLVYKEDNVACLNNYAYYLSLKQDQLDRAERMSYITVKAEPLNKTYLDTYAWILYTQGNYTMAKFYIDRAVSPSADDEKLLQSEDLNDIYFEHAAAIYEANDLPDQAERYRKLATQKKNEDE